MNNCKRYNEEDCATKNANCQWVKGQGCNRRPGVKAGKRYRYTPRGNVQKVRYLDLQTQTIDRYGNINPKEFIRSFNFYNKVNYPKDVYKKKGLFDILLTGLNYSVYDPYTPELLSEAKEFAYFYHTFVSSLPMKNPYDFCYLRFLQFMETNVTHCKTIKSIYIGINERRNSITHTGISYFTEMVKGCGPQTQNILIPIVFIGARDTHRNTLVVTPDRKVYRVEMNHKIDDEAQDVLVNYFKNSTFTFEGFYPENSVCEHDGLCNFLALLVYFVKDPTPEKVKEYFVMYALWEYKAMFKQDYIEKKEYINLAFDLYRFSFKRPEKSIISIKVNGNAIRLYELQQEIQKVDLVDINYKLSTTIQDLEFVDYVDRSFSYRNKITFTKNKRQQNSFGKDKSFIVLNREIKYLKS